LNVHQFASITDAQTKTEPWRIDSSQRRLHSWLDLTPDEFQFLHQDQVTLAAETVAFPN